ncbi:MAG TPA: class I SAM-dependent methyltransferase [Candidatus Paceibacterota bacterium]|jgi:SAM-dependent methyltransferase|nr:class I SAM-dependent methyltransferase [Candidatus Paceibacterota bacterium]
MAQYDDIAASYVRVKSKNDLDDLCLYPRLLRALGSVKGIDVLDLATGGGKVALMLSARGARQVVAVDESEGMLRIAASQRPAAANITYLQHKVGEMGQIGQFQKITAGWLFHYARLPEELRNMARDVSQNLAPGGLMVALNGNPLCPTGGSEKYGYFATAAPSDLTDGDVIRLCVFGNGAENSFKTRFWRYETYVRAFAQAGLVLKMRVPLPGKRAVKLKGREWWANYFNFPTSALFIARHR